MINEATIERHLSGTGLAPWALGLAALAAAGLGGVALLVLQVGTVSVLTLMAFLPVSVVMLLRPQLATLATAFLLYVNFPAILTKEHGMPAPLAGAFILALGFPILHALIVRRERLRADGTLGLLGVLLGCLLLSTFASVDTTMALDRVVGFLFEGLLLYWLLLNAVRSLTTLRSLFWTVLAAATLLSLLCLYQDLTGSYSQEFGGLAHRRISPGAEISEVQVFGRRPTWTRAQGPVDEPNRFAQTLIVLLPLAFFLYRHPRTRALRWWAAALGGATLLGVILTLSRGAFVTLAVMAFAMVVVRWMRLRHVLVAVLAAAVILPVVSPFFLTRLESIVNVRHLFGGAAAAQEADGAIRGRTTEMLAALAVFRDHPIVGVGPGQFPRFYFVDYSKAVGIKFRELDVPRRAHNLYLEMGAETGMLGLGMFLVVVLSVMRRLWRARRAWLPHDGEAADLATAVVLSLVAYLCTAMFLHLSYQRYYWFLIALAGVGLQILRAWPREAAIRAAEERRWRRLR